MAQESDIDSVDGALEQRRDDIASRIPAPDYGKEYVASGLEIGLSQVIMSLPKYADDLEREQGDEVYSRMMKDAAVATAFQTLVESVLMNEIRLDPAVTDEDDPDFDLSKSIMEFVQSNFKNMKRPMVAVIEEMMNAYVFGASVAEKIYEYVITPAHGLKLHLTELKPLVRKNYNFVVDDWGNVYGLMVRRPGQSSPLGFVDPKQVVERSKFAFLQFGVVGGDPRGRGQLRSVYNPWWFKMQLFPRWLKFIQQFSTPSLIGFTPEGDADDSVELKDANGRPLLNPDGSSKKITREQAMLNALVTFQAGSALALRGGSSIQLVQSTGNGEAFIESLDALNREIFLAVVGNSRASLEAKHGSKADSQSGQDSLSRKSDWIIGKIEHMINFDIVHQLVELNFGVEIAQRLSPVATMKGADKEDRATIMSAVASLWREKFFHASQVPGLDAIIGAPERDIDAWLLEQQDAMDAEMESQRMRSRISDPMQGI